MHDSVVATYVAVALNVAVAGVAYLLARRAPHRLIADAREPSRDPLAAGFRGAAVRAAPSQVLLVTIALSGFCALAAEVIWARALSLLLGATVYTFSIILAVFLVGLGLGSGTGAAMRKPRPAS